MVCDYFAVLEDQQEVAEVLYVFEGVAVHDYQVGDLAGFHRAEIGLHAAQGGAVPGGGQQRLPRRRAGLDP